MCTNSFPTPDMSCMTDEDKLSVYEPAEDTFLLLDSLEKDYQLIVLRKPTLGLEIGCGSGVVSTFLYNMLKRNVHILCTDINEKAALMTKKMAKNNNADLSVMIADLWFCFGSNIHGKLDLLIFNPPYVVTPENEIGGKTIEASWAGGIKGRQVLDRVLPHVNSLLSPKGLFYLVTIKENDIDDIENIMKEQGFMMTLVMSRQAGRELLQILRFQRCNT